MDIIENNFSKIVKYLFLLTAFIFLALCFFNFPSADDYSYSTQAINHGWLGAILNEYSGWGGRYTSVAILSLNPLVENSYTGYKIWSLLNILVFFSALYTFFKACFMFFRIDTKLYLPTFYFIFCLSFISWMPGVSQGFYWLAGYVTYTFPITMLLLLAAYLLRSNFNQLGITAISLLFLLMLIIVGFNETVMFILNASIWSFLAYWYYINKKINIRASAIATACLIGGIIIALAPGNNIRKSNFETVNPFYAAWKSLGSALEHIPQFLSPSIVIAALLLILFTKKNRHIFKHTLFHIKPLYTFLMYWAIASLGFFPAQLSMRANPDARVDNMFYLIFLLFLSLWCIQFSISKAVNIKFSPNKIILFLFLLSIPIGNIGIAAFDLILKAPNYRIQWIETIEKSKVSNKKSITLPAIINPPNTIHFETLTNDPNHWVNKAYAKYFNLEAISTQ